MIETLLAPGIISEKSIPIPAKLRVVLIVCLAMVTVLSTSWLTLWLFMALVVYLWWRSDLTAKQTIKRLLAMDCLILFTLALIPFSVPGEALFSILSITATKEGGLMAMMILFKANIVILAVMALSEGVDALTLGKALVELGVSRRFALLMQFTVRYIGLLYLEFHRLRQSMRVRGFKPSNSMHTWRSYGFLFGMLLVRSFDRADRISQAMKCRGFRGHFLSHQPLPVTKREYAHFAVYLSLIILIGCTSLSSFNV